MISKNRNNFGVIKSDGIWMFQDYSEEACLSSDEGIPVDNIFCIESSRDYTTIHYLTYCVIPGKEEEGTLWLRHARVTLLGTMKHFESEFLKCSEDTESTFLRTHRKHITNQRFVFKTSVETIDGRGYPTKCIWMKIPERIKIAKIYGVELRVDESKGLPEIIFPLSRTGKRIRKAFEKKEKRRTQAA